MVLDKVDPGLSQVNYFILIAHGVSGMAEYHSRCAVNATEPLVHLQNLDFIWLIKCCNYKYVLVIVAVP